VKKAAASITKKLNDAIADSNIYKDAARDLEDSIRDKKNPKTGKNYKKLQPSTIEHRKYIARNNSTHSEYSSDKSNLTLTGSLLEGLFSRFNKSTGILTIDIKGNHPGYKGSKKKTKGSRKSRKEIVEHLEDLGFPVLNVSNKFINKLVEKLEKRLRKI